MGFAFEIIAPSVDNEEKYFSKAATDDSLQALAAAKARSVSGKRPEALVLGADTVVSLDGTMLGKPKSKDDAAGTLRFLSGKTHVVRTSVALVCGELGFVLSATETTQVTFRPLEQWEIDEYLDHNEYRDKAGAYAIQGRAMAFVDRIDGCYYNVVGLPVRKTIDLFITYATRKDAQHG